MFIVFNFAISFQLNLKVWFIVDSVIIYTLSIGAVRGLSLGIDSIHSLYYIPHLPGVESVYLFLEFTTITEVKWDTLCRFGSEIEPTGDESVFLSLGFTINPECLLRHHH